MPSAPQHGTVMYNGSFYLDVASYQCNRWYFLTGPSHITCGPNGTWQHAPPFCDLTGKIMQNKNNVVKNVILLQNLFNLFKPAKIIIYNFFYNLFSPNLKQLECIH